MEYTQWGLVSPTLYTCGSLNPCCNGIYSMSNGYGTVRIFLIWVLILVVMEYTQWGVENKNWKV